MSSPSVCAVMLTADRPEMARQAVECFRRQTYARKRLLIMNCNTAVEYGHVPSVVPLPQTPGDIICVPHGRHAGETIGELRNIANRAADCPILIHWDDDDWSHPNRITEQVALLQATCAGCVGYREMLFWREPPCRCTEITATCPRHETEDAGESWLYRHPSSSYVLGTSMCYWRSMWEQRPFEHVNVGEDKRWIDGVKTVGVTSLGRMISPGTFDFTEPPRMVARIHGGNTSPEYGPQKMRANAQQVGGGQWRRVPERDEQCRRIFAEL